ncbi:VOC family protein [Pedobacter sp. PLR]|uniref:bleomycin resistance protein n=1 Tax=Pedobacter sp. PLR TaxID=2994465 RepID=UPI002247CCB8|nr:VOC family protein [Pedobacter sp. PLR]MCX2452794.1 VOC family protein [Pedobacter sp. PLR]
MLLSAVPILAFNNQAETIAFYTQKLGFTFHSEWDGYLIFSREQVFIHLWFTEDPAIPKHTGCYINVNKVEQLYQEYEQQGIVHPNGKLALMPWGMRQFSILDNNGNIIHFGEPSENEDN